MVSIELTHGGFNFPIESLFVRMAIARLKQKNKVYKQIVDNVVIRKCVIKEEDLILEMFNIEDESQRAGIDLRKV